MAGSIDRLVSKSGCLRSGRSVRSRSIPWRNPLVDDAEHFGTRRRPAATGQAPFRRPFAFGAGAAGSPSFKALRGGCMVTGPTTGVHARSIPGNRVRMALAGIPVRWANAAFRKASAVHTARCCGGRTAARPRRGRAQHGRQPCLTSALAQERRDRRFAQSPLSLVWLRLPRAARSASRSSARARL